MNNTTPLRKLVPIRRASSACPHLTCALAKVPNRCLPPLFLNQASSRVKLLLAPKIQLQARGLHKSYFKSKLEIPVLRGVDLDLRAGEFLAIIGQSGSGKSTLLHLLGTLDTPDAGEVHFWDHRIDKLPARARDRLRNEEFGMIFQFYHLLPELTAVENVLMPLMIRHRWLSYRLQKKKFEARAKELLDLVGLGHRLKHKPREMSAARCNARPSRGH